MNTNTIESNGGSGIFAWEGSTVDFKSGTIQNNSGSGVSLYDNSSLTLGQDGRVTANTRGGLFVADGSSVQLHGTVEDNLQDGVVAYMGSKVRLGDDALIKANQGSGINLQDTSVAAADGNTARIMDHGGWGIYCDPLPAVAQIARTGTIQFASNGLGTTNCPTN